MAMSNSERMRKYKEEREKLTASPSSNSSRMREYQIRKEYEGLGSVNDAYSGWQDTRTMDSGRSKLTNAQKNLSSYLDQYQSGMDAERRNQYQSMLDSYNKALDDYGKLSTLYSNYQNADAYNKAVNNYRLEEKYKGSSYDDIQKALASATDQDERAFLSTYKGYENYDDIKKAIDTLKAKDEESTRQRREKYGKNAGEVVSQYRLDLEKMLKENPGLEYDSYRNRSDFDEVSNLTDDELNKLRNYDSRAAGQSNIPFRASFSPVANSLNVVSNLGKRSYDNLSEEDKATARYIYKTKGEKGYKDYINYLNKESSKGVNEALTQGAMILTEEHPLAMGLASPLIDITTSLPATAEAAIGGITGNYDPNSGFSGMSKIGHAVGAKVGTKLGDDVADFVDKKLGENGFSSAVGEGLGEATKLGYMAFSSGVVSRVLQSTFGEAANVVLGAASFVPTYTEAIENGDSVGKAVAKGIAGSVIEWATEHFGMDWAFGEGSSMISTIAKQFMAEGSEELVGNILQFAADDVISKFALDQSDFQKEVMGYIEQGYSLEEARKMAAAGFIKETAEAFVSAGLSAGMTGTVHGAMTSSTGKNINSQALAEAMGMLNPESNVAQEYNDLINKYGDASKIPNWNKAVLYNDAYDQALKETYGNFRATGDNSTQFADSGMALNALNEAYRPDLRKVNNKQSIAEATKKETTEDVVQRLREENLGDNVNEEAYNESFDRIANAARENTDFNEAVKDLDEAVIDREKAEKIYNTISESQNLPMKVESPSGDVTEAQNNASYIGRQAENYQNEGVRSIFTSNYEGQAPEGYQYAFDYIKEYADHTSQDPANMLKHIPSSIMSQGKAMQIYNALTKNNGDIAIARKQANDKVISEFKGDYKKKGTFDDSGIDYSKLDKNQRNFVEMMKIFSDMGMNIRVFRDSSRFSDNGSYENGAVNINLDAYYNSTGDKSGRYAVNTFAHESTHWMANILGDEFANYKDLVKAKIGNEKWNELVTLELSRSKNKSLTEDQAEEEVMARLHEDMFKDNSVMEEILGTVSKDEANSLIKSVNKWYNKISKTIKEWLSVTEANSDAEAARFLRDMEDGFKEVRDAYVDMFKRALAINQQTETLINSDPVNVVNDNTVMLSEKTYENGGKAYMAQYLKSLVSKKELDEDDANQIMEQLDSMYELSKKFSINPNFIDYKEWQKTDALTDQKFQKAINAIVNNADYEYNIDFSTVCKKRKTLDKVLNILAKEGDFDDYLPSAETITELQKAIKEHGFEIACALCFVDAKRYRVGKWASDYINGFDSVKEVTNKKTGKKEKKNDHTWGYNELVFKMAKLEHTKADYFRFLNADKFLLAKSGDLHELKLTEDSPSMKFLKGIMDEYGSGTQNYKKANALYNNPELRKILTGNQIISSEGFSNIRVMQPDLFKMIDDAGGQNKPKLSLNEVAYTNEVIKQVGTDHDALEEMREKLKRVGGYRVQSFSDYVANMVFDYVQLMSNFAAAKYTAHAYTKEYYFVKLFGLTGMKINMSIVPKAVSDDVKEKLKNIKKDSAEYEYYKAHAGFAPATKDDYDYYDKEDGSYWKYILEDECFPVGKVNEIMKDARYSKNVGTIWVGVSAKHIRALLNDPRASMVIPYHKSGINPVVAHLRNIEMYNDYTNGQYEKLKGVKLSADEFYEKTKYNFYEALDRAEARWNEMSDEDKAKRNIPQMAADEYLAVCEEYGITPKFADIGITDEPNYYKVLADFALVDSEGNYAKQNAVTMTFPKNFGQLMGKSLAGAQNTSNRLSKRQDSLLKEAREIIDADKEAIAKKNAKASKKAMKSAKVDSEVVNALEEAISKENFKPFLMESDKGNTYLVTKSTRNGEKWQLSYLDDTGRALGHDAFADDEELLERVSQAKNLHVVSSKDSAVFSSSTSKVTIKEMVDDYEKYTVDDFARAFRTYDANSDTDDATKEDLVEILKERIEEEPEIGEVKVIVNSSLAMKSAKVDSEGRTLTDNQQKFFEHSVVRDAMGRLKVMYHGTPRGGFTVFGRDRRKGYFFTDSQELAGMIYAKLLYADNPEDYLTNPDKPMPYEALSNAYANLTDGNLIKNKDGTFVYDDENQTFGSLKEAQAYLVDNFVSYRAAEDENAPAVYEMYLNAQNPFVVNANGKYWNNLTLNGESASTDDICEYAFDNGYDSVIFNDIVDGGNEPSQVVVVFESEQAKSIYNENPTKNKDIRYSKKVEDSVADILGQKKRLEKENATLKKDVERLKSLVKLQSQVTDGKLLNDRKLDMVARALIRETGSKIDREELINGLKDLYGYILDNSSREDAEVLWDEVMQRAYTLSSKMLADQRGDKIIDPYYKEITAKIRRARIKLTPEQEQEARNAFGDTWRRDLFGRIFTSKDGRSLDSYWAEWSADEPWIFDPETNPNDQITRLSEIYDEARDAAEVVQKFNSFEDRMALAQEIYNKYWQVSTLNTVADKYQKEINKLKFEHRQAMDSLKASREKAKAELEKKDEVIKRIREEQNHRLAEYKLTRDRQEAERKQRAENNAYIKKITDTAMTLAEWLKKNDGKNMKSVPDALKTPVTALLNSIDFSSKRLLGMTGGIYSGMATKQDRAIADSLNAIRDYIVETRLKDAQNENDDENYFDIPSDIVDDMKELAKDLFAKAEQSNGFVLQKMSKEELASLSQILTVLKSSITNINKRFNGKGYIADVAKPDIEDNRELGKKQNNKYTKGVKSFFEWANTLPQYAFEHLGKGATEMFQEIKDGWNKFAFHVNDIKNFAKDTFTGKEYKEWSTTAHEYHLGGHKFKMTDVQRMSLYCLAKREQAMKHILKGGIKVAEFEGERGKIEGGAEADTIVLTQAEIEQILHGDGKNPGLTNRQIHVADALQKYMSTTCADWMNEVTMKRWGIKGATEDNYFPINVDNADLVDTGEPRDMPKSIFKLLNMGFTKALNEKANNPLVVDNIFDVFITHATDMAKYNSLALPVLDMHRYYNFKQKDEYGNTYNMKRSIETAYGKDAQEYIVKFLLDLNANREESRAGKLLKLTKGYKIAAVAANLQVAALQPVAITRAKLYLSNLNLLKGATHIKSGIDEMLKYSGIAVWKDLSLFDTNVARGIDSQIKQNDSVKDKVVEWSMKLAEWGDKITWGTIWSSCKAEQYANGLRGDELIEATRKQFEEVIYHTQVVDSTMTRSQIMRGTDPASQWITSFMSEPTVSMNLLQDAGIRYAQDVRRYGKMEAFRRNGRHIGRCVYIYCLNAAVETLLRSLVGKYRDLGSDDDKDEDYIKELIKEFLMNLNPLANIPIGRDIMSVIEGYNVDRMDMASIQSLWKAGTSISKVISGEKDLDYKTIYRSMQALSQLTGVPISSLMRDTHAKELWNATIGEMYPNLYLK